MVRESPVEPYPQLWKGGTTCRCADAPGSSKPEQDVLGSPVCLEQFVPIFFGGLLFVEFQGLDSWCNWISLFWAKAMSGLVKIKEDCHLPTRYAVALEWERSMDALWVPDDRDSWKASCLELDPGRQLVLGETAARLHREGCFAHAEHKVCDCPLALLWLFVFELVTTFSICSSVERILWPCHVSNGDPWPSSKPAKRELHATCLIFSSTGNISRRTLGWRVWSTQTPSVELRESHVTAWSPRLLPLKTMSSLPWTSLLNM